MRRFLVLLLLASPAWAATYNAWDPVNAPAGQVTLASAQTTTGASANSIRTHTSAGSTSGRGFYSAVFTYKTSAGTATVQTEISCDAGVSWQLVASSSKTLDASGTASDGIGVQFPQCLYRTNVTACSSCSVTTLGTVGARIGSP